MNTSKLKQHIARIKQLMLEVFSNLAYAGA